ncbi:MAG: MBL fold metallo-hydrolase, partial [Nocardioidaceae bacterium]
MTDVRVDHGVASGTFSLDGETFEVDNNIWVIGDDSECVVVDAPHNVADIRSVIADRRVLAVVCTHAHDDHVRVAPQLAQAVDAPVLLHPDDAPVWALTHPHVQPDGPLSDGKQIVVADIALTVLHTPGHSPGSVCLYSPDLGSVCTGDTLFKG